MASRMYNIGSYELRNGGAVTYTSDVIEVVFLKSTYVFDPDHTAGTPAASEITGVAGYVGGFGGAGRKVLGTKSISNDNVNDILSYLAANPTQYTFAAGDTVGGVLIQKKGSASDATAVPLAFIDVVDFATNGVPFTLTWDTKGVFWLVN